MFKACSIRRQKATWTEHLPNLNVVRTLTLIDLSGNDVLLNSEFQNILSAVETQEIAGVVVADQDWLVRADDLATLN